MIYNYCRRLKWSIVLFLGGCSIGTLAQNSFTSNSNTSVDSSNGSLVASQNQTQERIFIAGVFDTVVFDWGFEIFNLTVSLLNNRTDGFHDDIFPDGTLIEFDVVNDDCDDTKATQAYWSLRNGTSIVDDSGSNEMHGVVGSRCSGASIAIARIAALEGIPQVSPVSTSARLSDDNEYPFFSRMVAPGNANGEVGALIALLRNFDWTRVAILNMDTQYAKDIAASFRDLWEGEELNGEVSYSNTINLVASTGLVDEASVRQVLDEAPTGDPTVNSRIVVLLAQEEHAFPILKVAKDMGFQEDTIWIGVSWIGRDSPISTEWLSGFPGYLGIAPYENRNSDARDYLERVQQAQLAQGRTPWTELPHYAIAYTVDAILALATALSQVPSSDRRDGIAVTQQLRNLTYDGISGHVAFTENGDRAAPQYSLWNYQMGPEGTYDWIDVGSVGSELGSVSLTNGICFAQVGCNIEERMVPKDRYPVPRVRVPAWVTVLLLLFVVALFAVGIKYWHQRASHKATVEELQSKLSNLDDEVDAAVAKRNRLILERGNMMDKPDTWSDSDKVLVEVLPSEDQYWHVTNLLRETMNDAYVTKIWRVQNSALWSYYSFHKHRLAINGIDNNEAAVWHGTSNLDPSVIYCDQQDGFMMQYSRDGYWG